MDKAGAIELKNEILQRFYRNILEEDPSIRTQGSEPESRFERRFSVGHIRIRKRYRVEIRIQRRIGSAANLANEFKNRYRNDINIALLGRIEIPSKKALAHAVSSGNGDNPFTKRCRPLHIGLSVGHLNGPPGTLGAFVEHRDGDAVLSAAHILAPQGKARKGDETFQPGREGRQLVNDDQIGELRGFSKLSETGVNEFDAAFALLEKKLDHEGNKIPVDSKSRLSGRRINELGDIDELAKDTMVAKVGRTSHFTTGRVTATGVSDVTVFLPGVGNIKFDDLIEITWESPKSPFSRDGDSGSLLFTKTTRKALGLLFAGGVITINGTEVGVSYACSLKRIMDTFGLTWIS